MRPTKPMRSLRMGVKNMENRRVRNRRYKRKSKLAQSKNVEVKQNVRMVCRLVVR